MISFLKEVEMGMKGITSFIPGKFPKFDALTGTINKKMIYLVGAHPKVGKTAWIDERYVLYPYLSLPREDFERIDYIYYSMEIDIVEKMAAYCSYFMNHYYKIRISSDQILGRMKPLLTPEQYKIVQEIYNTHLKYLFGEFDVFGRQIIPGRIEFYQNRENPTGIYKRIREYAKDNGTFVYEKIKERPDIKGRLLGYEPKDPTKMLICMIDHVGLVNLERGYTKKENIDKLSQYLVEARNLFGYTFVVTSQFNRDMAKTERLKFSGEVLAPTLEDFKDTSNLSEDANQVFALFNPSKYNHLQNHFGYNMSKFGRFLRSGHLLVNRNGPSPFNFAFFFDGKIKKWAELPKPTEDLTKFEDLAVRLNQESLQSIN